MDIQNELELENKENQEDFKGDIKVNTQILINPSDWTIETILSLLKNGRININPEFQRRAAWNVERKSLFIESILLNYPLPQIILAEDRENKKFIVVDGKQRLLTLLQFSESGIKTSEQQQIYERFKLRGLERLTELEGKYYTDLQNDLTLQTYAETFNDFTIRTIVLKQWDKDALYDMFLRINQNSVILMPQELRQALFPGPFTSFIEQASSDSVAIRSIYGSTAPDPRMRDAELLLRFYAVKNLLNNTYNGNLKDLLDGTCEYFNDNWSAEENKLMQQLTEFEEGYKFITEALGKDINPFWKYENGNPIRRFNKAIFDFIMYYFSNPKIIDSVKSIPNYQMLLQNKFKNAFNDVDFLASVTSSTKAKGAFSKRLSRWAEILSELTGSIIEAPL